MMAVNTVWRFSVQASELFELAGYNILKRIRQSRVIQKPRETVREQIFADLLVMACQRRWNLSRRKRSAKIQVKADIESLLGSDARGAR